MNEKQEKLIMILMAIGIALYIIGSIGGLIIKYT
jgi:hypothetical protein